MKIGIMGVAGAGKDTIAELLRRELCVRRGRTASVQRYAAALKQCAFAVFGDDFDDRDVKDEVVYTSIYQEDLIPSGLPPLWALEMLHSAYRDKSGVCEQRNGEKYLWVESSPAKFQQLLGTEVGRVYSPDHWVDMYNLWNGYYTILIAPDCRFDNEVNNSDFIVFVGNASAPGRPGHVSEVLAEDIQAHYKFGGGCCSCVDFFVENDPEARWSTANQITRLADAILKKQEELNAQFEVG